MRSARNAGLAVVCVMLIGGSAMATEEEGTVFDQLHELDVAAADGQQRATRLQGQVAALDEELGDRWSSLDVSMRAAKPIRKSVTRGLTSWLTAHRFAEREAMDGPHAGADTRRLLRYAAPQALPSRLRDVDVVRRADNEQTDFVAALERRAQWTVELARTTAGAQAATGSRDVLIADARAGQSTGDLAATAEDFDAVLSGIAPTKLDVDFHRLKGTLARPITMNPAHRFGQQATLVRSSGWTYRAEHGTEVHAVGAGEIVYRGVIQGFGLVVVIDHGGGYVSSYAHLAGAAVNVGDEVERAEVFASVGDSGSLDGARLFFELRRQDEPIDPAGWFLKQ